MISFVRFRINR